MSDPHAKGLYLIIILTAVAVTSLWGKRNLSSFLGSNHGEPATNISRKMSASGSGSGAVHQQRLLWSSQNFNFAKNAVD